MLRTKQLFFLFIPAIALTILILTIRIFQYEPNRSTEKTPGTAETSFVPIFSEDPILGDKKASHTIILFEDFACETCKTQMAVLNTLLEQHPKQVKIIVKPFSIVRIPLSSERAHAYAFCAHEQQKFAEFSDRLFANSTLLSESILEQLAQETSLNSKALQKCLAGTAKDAYQQKLESLAKILNIQSVPTVFVNNTQITPPQAVEGWETLLQL